MRNSFIVITGSFSMTDDQFLGRAIDIARQFQDALHALGESGHLLHCRRQFFCKFRRSFSHVSRLALIALALLRHAPQRVADPCSTDSLAGFQKYPEEYPKIQTN